LFLFSCFPPDREKRTTTRLTTSNEGILKAGAFPKASLPSSFDLMYARFAEGKPRLDPGQGTLCKIQPLRGYAVDNVSAGCARSLDVLLSLIRVQMTPDMIRLTNMLLFLLWCGVIESYTIVPCKFNTMCMCWVQDDDDDYTKMDISCMGVPFARFPGEQELANPLSSMPRRRSLRSRDFLRIFRTDQGRSVRAKCPFRRVGELRGAAGHRGLRDAGAGERRARELRGCRRPGTDEQSIVQHWRQIAIVGLDLIPST